MVWALELPSSFGDFFPDGDYVGWRERLSDYFNKEMPAQKKLQFIDNRPESYIYHVVQKFIEERGKKFPDDPPIGPLEEHEKPKWFETEKRYNSLGSLIVLTSRLVAIDLALKEIIEQLEPGVHEFVPISITMPKNEVYPKPYYILIVGRFLESFVAEESIAGSWRKDGTSGYYFPQSNSKQHISNLAFSNSVIGGAHLWRERKLLRPDIFFSDTLQKEITKAGLRIPKHFQMKEVQY
jgi:hypothetical protein